MHVGVVIALTDRSVRPDQAARLVEARGLESLWVTEHTHIPVTADGEAEGLPEPYRRTLDPLVALTAAAAATQRLRLGTAVFLAAQHEPLVTAKAIASLDLLSGGRVTLGVGAGWVGAELRHHGIDPARRYAHLREHVDALRALWREEVASFDGPHVQFGPVRSDPKPVQPGGPPILLGADGPRATGHAVAFADGWLPRAPGGLAELAPRVAELWARCEAAGRPPLPVTRYGGEPDPRELDAARGLGLDRVIVRLPSGPAGEVEAALDVIAAAVAAADL